MTETPLPFNDRVKSVSPMAGTTLMSTDFELTREDGLTIVRVRATGERSALTLGVDFSFPSGLGDQTGAIVALTSPSLEGDRYILIGYHPEERLSDFLASISFDTNKINAQLDALTLIVQEHRRDIGRSLKSDFETQEQLLPDPAEGMALGWHEGKLVNRQLVEFSEELAAGITGKAILEADTQHQAQQEIGVEVGVDVQPHSANLDAWMEVEPDEKQPTDANLTILSSGSTPLGLTGRALLSANTDAEARTIIGAGLSVDAKVNDLAGRASYDDEPEGFMVLVSDIGDGRSAVYSKLSASSADWSDPAYVTGPEHAGGDTLQINSGRNYPLKAIARNGVTSTAFSYAVEALLDVKIYGARNGKFYRIEYYGNGNATYGFQVTVSEYDAETYSSALTAGTAIIALNDVPAATIEAGPIVTRLIRSTKFPGMAIEITIDRSKAGETTPWLMSSAGSPGINSYSWIIDPTCYMLAPWTLRPLETRTINSGQNFPLLAATRAGVTSVANAYFNGAFLDCRVRNAIPGKYYQVGYMQNGATIGGDSDDGVIIQEFDAADYEATGTPTIIQNHTDPAPAISRGAGVQTLIYSPPARPGLTVELVLDDALLPPQGTSIIAGNHTNSGFAAWSWIIDPICYDYVVESGTSHAVYGPMQVQIDPLEETASLIWSHGDDEMLRLRLGHVGKNNLFNIAGYDRATKAPIPSASWSVIVDTETDFFPPLIFHSTEAVVDEGAVQIYTGGNHGSDGSSGGSITASPLSWSCEVDGRALGEYFEGAAQRVVFRFTNQVMAWNTWSLPRYALRQHFTVIVTPGSLEFWAEVEALENITVQTDNGLQLLKNGYETVAFYNGDTAVRRPIADNWNAGPRSAAPDAWAGVLASPTNGYMASWMDRAYEAGDGRNLDPESPFIRTTPGKIYHAIVAAHATPMAPGAFYRYHGGYTWAPKTIVSGDLDSALLFMKSDKPHLAYAFLAAGSGTILLPRDFVGKSVGSQVISATNKIEVTASGTDYVDEAIT